MSTTQSGVTAETTAARQSLRQRRTRREPGKSCTSVRGAGVGSIVGDESRSPGEGSASASGAAADLSSSPAQAPDAAPLTLAGLPPGARLILRCRKDWRAAAVSAVTPDCVVLAVASPSGHTYRVRRPHDSPLTYDGALLLLSDRESSGWRVALARYDARW